MAPGTVPKLKLPGGNMGAGKQRQRPQELKKWLKEHREPGWSIISALYKDISQHTHTHPVFPASCKKKKTDLTVLGPHPLWWQSLQLRDERPLSKDSRSPVYQMSQLWGHLSLGLWGFFPQKRELRKWNIFIPNPLHSFKVHSHPS